MAEPVKRNYKAIVLDIAEGFLTVNPIYLKPFNESALKLLFQALERRQVEIRTEAFPYHNADLIRRRNLRLQRLYTAAMIIKNYAREKRFSPFKEQKPKPGMLRRFPGGGF